MTSPAQRRHHRHAAGVLALAVAALLTFFGCAARGAQSRHKVYTTCSPPYTFSVGSRRVFSGACAELLPQHAPQVTVQSGEQFSLRIIGEEIRDGQRAVRDFPVPRPDSSVIAIQKVSGLTVTYRAAHAGRARLLVRSRLCPSVPRVSTCSVLAVTVAR